MTYIKTDAGIFYPADYHRLKAKPPVTKKPLELHFGVAADSISSQLSNQGFKFSEEMVAKLEEQAAAASKLWMANLISTSAEKKVFNKIFDRICFHIKIKS
jgi:hypothetical protein